MRSPEFVGGWAATIRLAITIIIITNRLVNEIKLRFIIIASTQIGDLFELSIYIFYAYLKVLV